MKKLLSFLLIASIVASFAVSFSAEEEDTVYVNEMPDSDVQVMRTAKAPTIDAEFDGEDVWGAPIFSFTGDNAYDQSAHYSEIDPMPNMDVSWAITDRSLWTYPRDPETDELINNGSVELIRGAKFNVYARWDSENLYLCYIVDNFNHEFFYNGTTKYEAAWEGNSVQMSFAPTEEYKDQKENWSDKATDTDKNGNWVGGWVGNEYLVSITNETDTQASTALQLGTYKGKTQSTLRGLNVKAMNYPKDEEGKSNMQVYEMAFKFKDIGRDGLKDEKIPFATAFNFNIADELKQEGFNGIQVGQGIYQQDKAKIYESLALILTDDGSNVLKGDVTGDGVFDESDVIRLTRYFSGVWKDVDIVEANSDVTGDGKVDESDVIRLKRYFSGVWKGVVLE